MILSVLVAVAAGVGAVVRYVTDQVVAHRTGGQFPYGTLLINLTGSLLLGLVVGLSTQHGLPGTAALVIGTGFAGGYTTLSTWAWETLALAATGELLAASLNIVVSFSLGLAAAAVGLALTLL